MEIYQADDSIPFHLLQCQLCGNNCSSSRDFVLHYAEHFSAGKCSSCNQQLVMIRERIGHLQLEASCGDAPADDSDGDGEQSDWCLKQETKIDDGDQNTCCESIEVKVVPFTAQDSPSPPTEQATAKYTPKSKPRAKPQRRDPRTYQCYICKRFINHLPNLRRHVSNHLDRSLTCDQCGITCANWANMVHHKKIHSESKQYMCSYCGRGFHHRFNMQEHMFVHTRVKSYKCDSCGKMFGRRSGLDAHRLVHTGEKPNKCKMAGCDRAYMYSIDLKRHLFGAHGIYTKKHECKMCGKIFPENKLLVAHMKVH